MSDDIKVLGISGSLRSGSYNSARLLEIANACPIHRVLSGEVSVSSQLRD